eukprot:1193617-Prorocentrum_minimum.AAC.6
MAICCTSGHVHMSLLQDDAAITEEAGADVSAPEAAVSTEPVDYGESVSMKEETAAEESMEDKAMLRTQVRNPCPKSRSRQKSNRRDRGRVEGGEQPAPRYPELAPSSRP